MPWIAEFWNTLSNLGLVLLSAYRLLTTPQPPPDLWNSYWLMFFCGIGSGFHHAFPFYGSIVIDWIPILMLAGYAGIMRLDEAVDHRNFPWICAAVGWFLLDQVFHLFPVPWGHSIWHLLAATAIDQLLQSWHRKYEAKRKV